jgi:hypothetical protein
VREILAAVFVVAVLASVAYAGGPNPNPGIAAPGSTTYGLTYPEWAAEFWKWAFALPCDGHPFHNSKADYDLNENQSGKVRFWSFPDEFVADGDPVPQRSCTATLGVGKALFLTTLDVESSSLETIASGFHGGTEAEQRELAKFYADHIVGVFCSIDDVPVVDIGSYRFSTPQFKFKAPTPWVFGGDSGGDCSDPTNIGGKGTSVGEGYFLLITSLSKGLHVIHYGGAFHFTAEEGGPFDVAKDVTIYLTVE